MKRTMRAVCTLTLMLALGVFARAAEPELQTDALFAGTDQFSKLAKNVTEVNLDKRMLAMMDRFVSSSEDKDQSSLAKKMEFVYVRSYEYDKPGQYKREDLDAFRLRLDGPEWSHVVKERSKDEQNDVWIRTDDANQFSELVVISAEASELSFVHLKGHMSVDDLEKAGAKYGVSQAIQPKKEAAR